MSKKLIFIVIGIVAVLGLVIFMNRGSLTPGASSAGTEPHIVVSSVHAYLVEDGARGKELATGDTITVPATIETDASGKASVFFADGSVARLEGDTRITLRESSYDAKKGKLIVRLTLTVGRVWSKIVQLTTSDSAWEVETSQAVAAVRGSAFGVKNDSSGSTFIGSEHTIGITPIDPKTGTLLTNKTVSLGEDKFVVVTDDDVAAAVGGSWQANIKDVSTDVINTDWVNENKSADDKQDNILSGLSNLSSEERIKRLLESFGVLIENVENGGVNIKTDDGTFFTSSKLPADFPSDVPIYPGAKVQGSVTTNVAQQGGHYVGLETSDAASKVASWYKAEIISKGWEVSVNMEAGGSLILGGSKNSRSLMVTISGESGMTVIGLAVSQQ